LKNSYISVQPFLCEPLIILYAKRHCFAAHEKNNFEKMEWEDFFVVFCCH